MTIYLDNDAKGWLPGEVLRSSILSRTSLPIEFKELHHFDVALSPRVPSYHSFFRWSIPAFQKYQGRVLFVENGSIFFDDIQKLFDIDMHGKGILAKEVDTSDGTNAYLTNLMLMQCDELQHFIPHKWAVSSIQERDFMTKVNSALPGSPNHDDMGPLDPNWNCSQFTPETKMFHFQHVVNAPWKIRGGDNHVIFLKELRAGVEKGYISLDGILHEIQLGHVYNQILEDMMSV